MSRLFVRHDSSNTSTERRIEGGLTGEHVKEEALEIMTVCTNVFAEHRGDFV
jgi:hypothetical protein